jgi:hypothetical protein
MKNDPVRRKRSDSAAAAIVAAQSAALGPLNPPAHVALRDGDRPFWDAIMKSRARDTWTDSDLTTAATMARAQADIERLQADIDVEGYTVANAKGIQIINPKATMLETLSKRVVALSRVLHVHAEATIGRSRDAVNALANERAAADEDDDLIPTLRVVA